MTYNREAEIARYVECYKHPEYAMGEGRKEVARKVLADLPKGWLLDVGAGRGELYLIAKELGYTYWGIDPATGTDVLTFGGFDFPPIMRMSATDIVLTDSSFDVVCCLDVLEHLIPDDVIPALKEMDRVCKGVLFLTASHEPSIGTDGKDLHISARPIVEWDALFDQVFPGRVRMQLGMCGVSTGWLIYKETGITFNAITTKTLTANTVKIGLLNAEGF